MIINNGIFTGNDAAIFNGNEINGLTKLYIYDGVFNSTNTIDQYALWNSGTSGGETKVYGGMFKGNLCLKDNKGDLCIIGGTFERNPEDRYINLPDGYEVVNNGNGTWTVKKSN